MARWKFSPIRLGVWGMMAIVLAGAGRCGRERENPVDPNFPGGGALQPPGNIRAQGDIGRILLTWDAVKINELAGYGVWRAASATGDYTRLRGESNDANVTTGRTVFVDSTMDVSASRVYFYRITTVDVNGQSSDRSAFVSAEAREDKRPPASPANLSAVRDENTGRVALFWDAPKVDADNQDLTGLDGYRVFRAKDSEDAYVLIATVPASQTTYMDTSQVDTDVRYFYQVSAVDRFDNESARSRSVSVSAAETGIAPPGGLRTVGKVGKIELHWNPSNEDNLLGYLVLRSKSTQAPFEPVSSDAPFTTAQTVYIDTDVQVDEVYFYRVKTVVQDPERGVVVGDESPFVDGRAEVDESPPAAPSDLSVSLDDENAGVVLLSWAPPKRDAGGDELTGLDGYRIFRAKDTEDAYILIAAVPASQTTYTDTTQVDTDVRYFYQVSAIDRFDNESARSRSVSVSAPETGIAPPGGLRTVGKVGKIELHWNPSNEDNLLGYLVLRSKSTQAPFEPVSSDVPFTTAQTVYIDTDVQVDEVYFYRVQTVIQDPERGIVVGDASPFVDGQAEADESPPAAPSDLSVSLDDENAGVVLLSWAPPSRDADGDELTGLSHYRVFRSKETASSFVEMAQVPGVQTTYRDTSVEPLTLYYYTVNAVDFEENGGPRSAPVSVSTPGLATPTRVAAIAGEAKITLAWAPNSEAQLSGYEVLRYSDPLQPDVFSTFSTPWPAYVDSPLVGGKTYAYRVRALGSGGLNSRLSDFVLATVLDDDLAPAAPEFLYVKLSGNTDIELSWRASTTDEDGSEQTGLHQYRIYRSEGSGSAGYEWIATVDSTRLSYLDEGLEASTMYSYQVRAIDGAGNESEASRSVSLETGPAVEDEQAPGPPEFLYAELSGNTAIQLSWRASTTDEDGTQQTGLSHYRIYRSGGTGSAGFSLIATVDSTNLRYRDSGLETSTTYVYQVRAVDASENESEPSNAVSLTTGARRLLPRPTNVAAVVRELEDEGLAVVVTWRAPAGISSFGVYRQTAGASSSNRFETVAFRFSSTRYIDTDVVSGNTYIYYVLSLDGSALSDPSDKVVVAVP